MSEWLSTVRGAITLDIPTLVRFREGGDVFRRGIVTLIVVGLVLGAVEFAVVFIRSVSAPPVEVQMAEVRQGFDQMLQFMPPDAAEAFQEQFLSNFEAGMRIAENVEALTTPLPGAVGDFFRALGAWVSKPLAMLGGFLAYGIWVMLAAKLLGGTGRLQEFLGTAALSSIPYLLLILNWVPCLGGILGFVAWVWSSLIWIAATTVAHGWAVPEPATEGAEMRYQVDWGRGLLAVILPVLALIVLIVIILVVVMILVLIASAFGSGG
jgi:hypothetical protein